MTSEALFNSSIVIRHSSFIATAFLTFGTQHLVTLGVITALCALLYWAARNRDSTWRAWLGRVLGIVLLTYIACIYAQQGIEHMLSWEYSLPLDLCNLVLAACIIALFRPGRFIAEIAYFWGLGGGLQAVLTPDLAQGFPSWDFALFFWDTGRRCWRSSFFFPTKISPRARIISCA